MSNLLEKILNKLSLKKETYVFYENQVLNSEVFINFVLTKMLEQKEISLMDEQFENKIVEKVKSLKWTTKTEDLESAFSSYLIDGQIAPKEFLNNVKNIIEHKKQHKLFDFLFSYISSKTSIGYNESLPYYTFKHNKSEENEVNIFYLTHLTNKLISVLNSEFKYFYCTKDNKSFILGKKDNEKYVPLKLSDFIYFSENETFSMSDNKYFLINNFLNKFSKNLIEEQKLNIDINYRVPKKLQTMQNLEGLMMFYPEIYFKKLSLFLNEMLNN